jgi:hypothetical protein
MGHHYMMPHSVRAKQSIHQAAVHDPPFLQYALISATIADAELYEPDHVPTPLHWQLNLAASTPPITFFSCALESIALPSRLERFEFRLFILFLFQMIW